MNDEKKGTGGLKFVPFLVVGLIIASFFIGNLSAKVAFLERGGTVGGVASGGGNGGSGGGNDQGVAPAPPPSEIDAKAFSELADGGRVIGDKKAKVAIVEFSDFQCPFCKSFFDATLPLIKKDYIDKGKVKLVYRHYPLTAIHPYAMDAALASECANEQGKFEGYHDKLFQNQTAITKDDLKRYAVELKMNAGKFNNCLDDAKYRKEVDADVELASKNGVSGTPGFFVNGKVISGAVPFENFKSVIDAEL